MNSEADAVTIDGETSPIGVTSVPVRWLTPMRSVQVMLAVVVLLLSAGTLWLGRGVLVPVTAGLMLALLCMPIVRRLTSWGLWTPLAAAVVVGSLALATLATVAMVATPAMEWIENAPQHLRRVEQRVQEFRRPMRKFTEAGAQLNRITGGDELVQKVEMSPVGFPWVDWSLRAAGSVSVVLVLCYFLLVYWDDLLLNLLRTMPRLSARKDVVSAFREAEHDVSHFLLVRTAINVGLGLVLWPVFYAIGLPNPALWAAVGGVFNFAPYVGALTAFVLICVVSLSEFESWGAVAMAPAAFAMMTTIEGFIVSPLACGRGLKLNPVVVFLGLVFWGWIWGIMGALMAVPLLVFIRVVCAHFEPLQPIGRLMGSPRDDDVTPTSGNRANVSGADAAGANVAAELLTASQ